MVLFHDLRSYYDQTHISFFLKDPESQRLLPNDPFSDKDDEDITIFNCFQAFVLFRFSTVWKRFLLETTNTLRSCRFAIVCSKPHLLWKYFGRCYMSVKVSQNYGRPPNSLVSNKTHHRCPQKEVANLYHACKHEIWPTICFC